MKKLRLLLFEKCDRNCDGCCNKDWDLSSLETEDNFNQYDIVMLTGGEPMLSTSIIIDTVYKIRKQSNALVYLYTAKTEPTSLLINILSIIDGVTITLHEQNDVSKFLILNDALIKIPNINDKSLRLNIFDNINIDTSKLYLWAIKDKIKWIKNCPLPENEVFKRV